jgi:hypothetical protein
MCSSRRSSTADSTSGHGLFKDGLSPTARAEWDAAHANPAAQISADPEVQAAQADLDAAKAAYTAARRAARGRLFG